MTDYLRHPDYLALLRGVCEDPDADLPRLVLADWLDERGGRAGEIHAGFIRTQVAGGTSQIPPTVMRDVAPVLGSSPWHRTATSLKGVVTVSGSGGLELTYRRGFVSAVTLTQAAFLGGPCVKGHGAVLYFTPGATLGGVEVSSKRCPQCDGTGRTPGLAAALFGAHPVVSVTLSDRAPGHPRTGETSYRTGWFCGHPASSRPEDLPQFLAPLLRADPLRLAGRDPDSAPDLPNIGWHWFATHADAVAALSRACVNYGRHVAGLTPLIAPVDAEAPAR